MPGSSGGVSACLHLIAMALRTSQRASAVSSALSFGFGMGEHRRRRAWRRTAEASMRDQPSSLETPLSSSDQQESPLEPRPGEAGARAGRSEYRGWIDASNARNGRIASPEYFSQTPCQGGRLMQRAGRRCSVVRGTWRCDRPTSRCVHSAPSASESSAVARRSPARAIGGGDPSGTYPQNLC